MTNRSDAFNSPDDLGHKIKTRDFEATGGLTVSVGISNTKAVAKIASDFKKPNGLTIVYPNMVADFLAPLPVSKLWGVGPKAHGRMTAAGFTTIGDVAKASDQELGRLGTNGPAYRRLAQGVDYRSVGSKGRPKSIGWERTLEIDLPLSDALMEHVKASVMGVCERIKNRNLKAGGVRVKLKTSDFKNITRQQHLPEATDDPEKILVTATTLLNSIKPGNTYRLVGVATFALVHEAEGMQMTLFDHQ